MLLPRLVITDIDGVWTDAGMYYSEQGDELKKFNTRDSAGVIFLRHLNIPVVIISGENTKLLERRAAKLGISHLHQGVKNKLAVATHLCDQLGIQLEDCAYIGDDINDIPLLEKVGISACPSDAPDYIKSRVQLVMSKKGGDAVFREFVELILSKTGKLDECVAAFVNQLTEEE